MCKYQLHSRFAHHLQGSHGLKKPQYVAFCCNLWRLEHQSLSNRQEVPINEWKCPKGIYLPDIQKWFETQLVAFYSVYTKTTRSDKFKRTCIVYQYSSINKIYKLLGSLQWGGWWVYQWKCSFLIPRYARIIWEGKESEFNYLDSFELQKNTRDSQFEDRRNFCRKIAQVGNFE